MAAFVAVSAPIVVYSIFQLCLLFGLGETLALRPLPAHYVHYVGQPIEFALVAALWAIYPALLIFVGALIVASRLGLDRQTRRDKEAMECRVAEELTRTGIAFEDQSVVERYDRS